MTMESGRGEEMGQLWRRNNGKIFVRRIKEVGLGRAFVWGWEMVLNFSVLGLFLMYNFLLEVDLLKINFSEIQLQLKSIW